MDRYEVIDKAQKFTSYGQVWIAEIQYQNITPLIDVILEEDFEPCTINPTAKTRA